MGPGIVLRDETYFQAWPILLVVEPAQHDQVLLGVVSADAQAETWGAALRVSQAWRSAHQGPGWRIWRACTPSPKRWTEVAAGVQKDTWHVERGGSRVRHALQRLALAAVARVDQREAQWRTGVEDETVFLAQYIPAVAQAEHTAWTTATALPSGWGICAMRWRWWTGRSGEIRDHARPTPGRWRRRCRPWPRSPSPWCRSSCAPCAATRTNC